MTPSPSRPTRRAPRGARYRVALTERASVVARGEQLELWFVRVNDAWVRAVEHPSAAIESSTLEPQTDNKLASEHFPSGTVWQRSTELVLDAGTQLLLRQSAPRPRRLSVMSYLKQGLATTQRVVRERHFIVTGNYRLTPVGRMQVNTVTTARAGLDSNRPGADSNRAGSNRAGSSPAESSDADASDAEALSDIA